MLDRYPIELSGGMKQRVVMVLSTLLDPSLLIADELTSALDVSTQKAVAEMLVEFRDREFVKSTIVITHDLSILYQIADTILIMYAGKLVEKASATEITQDPRHPYTQLLLGSLPEVGVRFADKRLQRHPRPAAVAARTRRRAAASGRAARSRSRGAPRSRRSSRSSRIGMPPAGRRPPMLEVAEVTKVFKTGMFGGGELTAGLATSASSSRPGEVVSLIGESGSGKTTVGRMILRL